MADDECWDANPVDNNEDEDDLDDDWDIDSEEEALKKEEKRKAEEAEKEKLKSLKQKMKERDEAERRKKEERLKEMNRVKTAEEIEKEQIDAQLAIGADMLGLGDEDDICSGVQSSKVSQAGPINDDEINLLNFRPKTKKDFTTMSDMITKKIFEYENSPEFKSFLDQTFRSIANRFDEDRYQVVMDLGKAVSSIGNNKQQDWKKKNKKTKKGTNKPSLGKSQTGAAQDTWNDDYGDYDDFM